MFKVNRYFLAYFILLFDVIQFRVLDQKDELMKKKIYQLLGWNVTLLNYFQRQFLPKGFKLTSFKMNFWFVDILLLKEMKVIITIIEVNWSYSFWSNSGEVYSMQHYVIKFVNHLRQVGGFRLVFRFPPPIKLTATI